jgi:hypothetical protein
MRRIKKRARCLRLVTDSRLSAPSGGVMRGLLRALLLLVATPALAEPMTMLRRAASQSTFSMSWSKSIRQSP